MCHCAYTYVMGNSKKVKLYDNKRLKLIAFSIALGICLAAYLIYEQKGQLESKEFITLGITLLLAIIITLVMIKIENKK